MCGERHGPNSFGQPSRGDGRRQNSGRARTTEFWKPGFVSGNRKRGRPNRITLLCEPASSTPLCEHRRPDWEHPHYRGSGSVNGATDVPTPKRCGADAFGGCLGGKRPRDGAGKPRRTGQRRPTGAARPHEPAPSGGKGGLRDPPAGGSPPPTQRLIDTSSGPAHEPVLLALVAGGACPAGRRVIRV
jgi:hypothetical protein